MELKYKIKMLKHKENGSSNRTFMELKYNKATNCR